jgi:hypothetical protein
MAHLTTGIFSFKEYNGGKIINYNFKADVVGELTLFSINHYFQKITGIPEIIKQNDIKKLVIGTNVTLIGAYGFYGCENIEGDLIIPNSVSFIGAHAFSNCKKLKGNLTLPVSLLMIDAYAFYKCYNFSGNLIIPDSVKTIGVYAFANCGFNGNLKISCSMTQIKYGTFSECNFLQGILVIPKSIKEIGELAFIYCDGFSRNLSITSSVDKIGAKAFYSRVEKFIIPDGALRETKIGELAFSSIQNTSDVPEVKSLQTDSIKKTSDVSKVCDDKPLIVDVPNETKNITINICSKNNPSKMSNTVITINFI